MKQKPKLKKGDKLICITDKYTDFTKNKEYDVIDANNRRCVVENDKGLDIYFYDTFTVFKLKEEPITLNEFISDNWAEKLKINDTAYKETEGKLFYELDFEFITQMAERMAANKGKYEPYNWQKLDNVEELKQALFRHTLEVMKGNLEDDGRDFGHLEAIACDVMMIYYQLKKKQIKNYEIKIKYSISQ